MITLVIVLIVIYCLPLSHVTVVLQPDWAGRNSVLAKKTEAILVRRSPLGGGTLIHQTKCHPPTVASDSSTLDNVYLWKFLSSKDCRKIRAVLENIGMKVITAINFPQDHFNKAISKADDKIKSA